MSCAPLRAAWLMTGAALAAFPAPQDSKPNSEPLYRSLRDSGLGDTLVVENIVLHRDAGVLTLKSGVIGFTAPAMGRDTVAVFVGEGEFAFTPGPAVEKNYLKSLTQQETVLEPFDRAMLCFTDDTGKEIRGQAKTKGAEPKLAETLRDYRKRLRSRSETPRSLLEALLMSDQMDNVEADILADLYNPRQPGFFSAYLHGRKHSDLRFHMRPRGAFPEMATPEEVALINLDPEAPQEGIWYLSHLQPELEKKMAASDENKRVVQADQYRIETTIARNDHIAATTELSFHAVTDGDRVVKLALLPNLRVSKVTSGGKDVPFVQEDRKEDGSFYVIMADAMPRDSAHQLVIEYQGDKVLHKAGGGNFNVQVRENWYPNVNTFHDHARYDLTFRAPKQYTLVGVGTLEKEWTEKDSACTHWVSEVPLLVAGFNFGSFKVKKLVDSQTGVGIEGYAATDAPDSLKSVEEIANVGSFTPSRLMDPILAESENALRIYSAWFGKPVYARIAITQQPEFGFGQSWPTLVYLPISAFLDSTQRVRLMGRISQSLTAFVDEVPAHEMSHQWWGHMVGNASYHDEWLSEGFATFSAGLYLQLTEKTPNKYLEYWDQARKRILDKNNFGRRANDAGPLWLGRRLDSYKNDEAYNDVIYRKGGFVLHMLRQLMFDPKQGDKPFMAMMQDFVRQHANANATTESFQRVVEQHVTPAMDAAGDHKMDWFFRDWVYGTTIPRHKFDYTVTDAPDGKFLLKASLTQSEVTPDFGMLVPIYLDFDGQIVRLGTARMVGNTTANDIQVTLPKKPKRVMINYWHDVLEMQ